ncbi:NAD-dependent epimerase/dehydratase family protein [Agromyces sp. NPDC055520]
MTTHVWIVGARGLLGSAIATAASRRPDWVVEPVAPLPWSDPDDLGRAVKAGCEQLLRAASRNGGRWAIIWAAGLAVTATPQEELDGELATLGSALDVIEHTVRLRSEGTRGVVFYASSAGGIYAGSSNPPFDETTEPRPIAPYGRHKLDAEARVREFAARSGTPAIIGRITNLYGPGQRLDKMQGLISHLAFAQLSPKPASIYVSLDTLRDYLFTADCANLLLASVGRLLDEQAEAGTVVVKNLTSGQTVSIADLLDHFRILAKRHPHVMLGSSANAALQARDLRVRSVVWPDLDRRETTPLVVGIHATLDDMRAEIQKARPR